MLFHLALAMAIGVATSDQTIDTAGMMARIRADVQSKLPRFGFERGNAVGRAPLEGFVLRWRAENDNLDVVCNQYESADEAIRALRGLRWGLSAGIPAPLPGVADEAYSLTSFRQSIYFARWHYVCQGGSLNSAASARALMDIVIAQIDATVSRRS
jgi:hypothetical protein